MVIDSVYKLNRQIETCAEDSRLPVLYDKAMEMINFCETLRYRVVRCVNVQDVEELMILFESRKREYDEFCKNRLV